ncbi:hypothetical protein RIR_jg42354.t1 [Rhizophagus irregularis DAOM 181602=DAOM 197198]|nr:hypothetical protein RIR_jg42354.t1 [Rhizophagus irregularis DAOM 181602=DAOM 197198]
MYDEFWMQMGNRSPEIQHLIDTKRNHTRRRVLLRIPWRIKEVSGGNGSTHRILYWGEPSMPLQKEQLHYTYISINPTIETVTLPDVPFKHTMN